MAEQLNVDLNLDAQGYVRGIKQASGATDQFTKTASSSFGKMSGTVGKLGKVVGGAFAAKQVLDFAGSTVTAATNLEESINAVNVVFGDGAEKVLRFGESAATSVGLAQSAFNQLATPLGAMLQNAGFAADEAADKTIQLTQRAADMASVFNTDVSQALGAIQAALRGEIDPIERFGVSMNAAAIEAKVLEMGLAETKGEIDATDKAAARLALIMEQTESVAGDFANTSDSLANKQRTLAARFEDLKTQIGAGLVPVMSGAVSAGGLLIDMTSELISQFSDSANAVKDMEEATRVYQEKVLDGVNPTLALANSLAFLGEQGRLNLPRLQGFIDAADLTAEQAAIAINKVRVWGEEMGLSAEQAGALEIALFDQISALDLTSQEIGTLMEKYGLAGFAMSDTADQLFRNEAASRKARAEAERLKTSTDQTAFSFDTLADKIRDATRAQAEAVNPVLRVVSANERLLDARSRLEEVEADASATTADLISAQADLVGAQADASVAAAELRTTLGESAEAFAETARQAGLSQEDIEEFVEFLNSIPSVIPIHFDVTTPETPRFTSGGIPFLQQGGIVPGPIGAPTLAVVHGGETVIPVGSHSSSTINNHMAITINIEGSGADVEDLQTALIMSGITDLIDLQRSAL